MQFHNRQKKGGRVPSQKLTDDTDNPDLTLSSRFVIRSNRLPDIAYDAAYRISRLRNNVMSVFHFLSDDSVSISNIIVLILTCMQS